MLAALALELVVSQFVAQNEPFTRPQDHTNIKVKGDRVIGSISRSRCGAEIYAKIGEAQRNEDIEALRADRFRLVHMTREERVGIS